MTVLFPPIFRGLLLTGLALLICAGGCRETPEARAAVPADSLLSAARDIMSAARYCALTTMDDSAKIYVRAMDPFPPEDDFTIWMATNPRTRKAAHIRANPQVVLYYFDAPRGAYVSLRGTARLMDDAQSRARYWKDGWEAFYPDRQKDFLLIAVTPVEMELVSEAHGIVGDTHRWRPPTLKF